MHLQYAISARLEGELVITVLSIYLDGYVAVYRLVITYSTFTTMKNLEGPFLIRTHHFSYQPLNTN